MDCPDFKCHKCGGGGHFKRNCDAVCCPDCKEVMDRCECWMEGENEEENYIIQERGEKEEHEEERDQENKQKPERKWKAQVER